MDAKTPSNDMDALRAEIQALRDELKRVSQNTESDQRDFAREIQDELRQTLNKARDKGEEVLDQARASGDKAIAQLEKQIEERPLLTLLLVFFAGLLLSRLMDRR